jgi:hypothetical protein
LASEVSSREMPLSITIKPLHASGCKVDGSAWQHAVLSISRMRPIFRRQKRRHLFLICNIIVLVEARQDEQHEYTNFRSNSMLARPAK